MYIGAWSREKKKSNRWNASWQEITKDPMSGEIKKMY